MLRIWVLGGLAVVLLGSVLMARQGVVTTREGQRLQGEVTERDEDVVVTIRGVQTRIPRDQVASIEYLEEFEQQYQQRREALAPNDAQGRYELARWAFGERQYEHALEAVEEALRIDPAHADARTLRTTIQSQIRLEQRREEEARRREEEGIEDDPRPARIERRVLSEEQINAIRQHEMRPGEQGVRIHFERDVRRRFAAAIGWDVREFLALSAAEQAEMIFRHTDQRFREDVRIINDPSSLLEYRRRIQPQILAGCASSGCHGGPAGGEFVLYNPADRESAAYTNFFILQQYAKSVENGGFFEGEVQRRMIDRTQPAQSLLAQYGLPRELTDMPHPETPRWRPIFRNRNDPRYRELVEWMGVSLRAVEPAYGIDFDLPTPAEVHPPVEEPQEETPEEDPEAEVPEEEEMPVNEQPE